MSKPIILILGGTGCLGSALVGELFRAGYPHKATSNSRYHELSENLCKFTVGDDLGQLLTEIKPQIIINCIVAKNNRFHSIMSVLSMFYINSIFPRQLARASRPLNIKVFNISSDAVFLGIRGGYREKSFAIPRNIYALSKRLGESKLKNVHNIRFSFVPRYFQKAMKHNALFWLLSASESTPAHGHLNHYWNGITDETAAKLLVSIAENEILLDELPPIIHFYSSKVLSKFELAEIMLRQYTLLSSRIVRRKAGSVKNFTLSSNHQGFLLKLWASVGYENIPSFTKLL